MSGCDFRLRRQWTAATATLFLAFFAGMPASAQPAAPAEVFVLGTLYSRHQSTPMYDLGALRRIILAVEPDVLVIDCTPTEVRERKVHPGKIEYPQVVFPLMDTHGYRVYAAEPDEPLFSEIVEPLAAARSGFARSNPEPARILGEYEAATRAALKLHWRTPAEVHDELTALVLAGRTALDARLHGEIQTDAQARWNEHWAAAIRRAAAENPGSRILALAGLENRQDIVDRLRHDPGLRIVEMADWLRRSLP